MKKILIIGASLVIIALAGLFFFRGKGNEPQFRTDKVTKGDIVMSVTATGTVNPVTTVLVGHTGIRHDKRYLRGLQCPRKKRPADSTD